LQNQIHGGAKTNTQVETAVQVLWKLFVTIRKKRRSSRLRRETSSPIKNSEEQTSDFSDRLSDLDKRVNIVSYDDDEEMADDDTDTLSKQPSKHPELDELFGVDPISNNPAYPGNAVTQSDPDDEQNNNTSLHEIHLPEIKRVEYATSKFYCSRNEIEQHFGKSMDEAAKNLCVSRSTLKRICRKYSIGRWPSNKRIKNHQQLVNAKNTEKLVQTNNDQTNQSTEKPAKIVSPLEDASRSSVIIRAKYEDDIIKFLFSTSSGVDELRKQISVRLGLAAGSFKLKYEDADGDWVLITCDDDIQFSLGSSSLSGSTGPNNKLSILVLPTTL
jgi:hypothetical protein